MLLSRSSRLAFQGGYWKRDFGPSHGTSLPDAFIAATAATRELELATHNAKHFPMLDEIIVPY